MAILATVALAGARPMIGFLVALALIYLHIKLEGA